MKLRTGSWTRHRSRGFSIVEMLVAVAIGLVISLAAFGMLTDSENRKRTSVSVNDANQSGAYAVYTLDRVIRSAGTGYSQGWSKVGACRINAVLPGETLPRTAAFPAPFAAVTPTLRLAPVVIFKGASAAGSDVLMVMSGAAGFGEAPATVPNPGAITTTQVLLANTIGFRANDLVMLSGGGECLLTQVATTKTACAGDPLAATPTTQCGDQLPLGGDYAAGASSTAVATLNSITDVNAFAIGNTTDNRPQFQLYGVGADSTLFSHDLLLLNGIDTSLPVAEGVVELRAVYGIDTNADGILDGWADPGTAPWDATTLMDGTPASVTNLRSIVAVRAGLVMRSALPERDDVAPAALPLFADLPAAVRTQRDLTAAERKFRHRTVEHTVPVRNLLLR